MIDLAFFLACGLAGALPGLIALWFGRAKVAFWIAVGWLLASILTLSAIGLGPHGFILFAFMPFWAGWFVALIVIVARWIKGRSVE